MSYDFALWEGPPPADDAAAVAEFEARIARAEKEMVPPSPRTQRFIDALLARHPDLEEPDDESPWAAGAPQMNDISGSFIYLVLRPSKADETLPLILEAARAEGLVTFDPQIGRVLTDEPQVERSRWWRRR